MDLRKQRELKDKMLSTNPRFMEEKFDSGVERANEARRKLDEYFKAAEENSLDEPTLKGISDASKNLSLGLNHAAFTYNPESPEQVAQINDIMRNANEAVQLYGEELNQVIHNYPYVGESFDHIYDIMDSYYGTDEGAKLKQDLQQELRPEVGPAHEPQHRPEPAPASPGMTM